MIIAFIIAGFLTLAGILILAGALFFAEENNDPEEWK